jgi:putative membrane protein
MNEERKQWLSCPPQEELAKKLGIGAWFFSAVVILLVVGMQKIRLPLPNGWSTACLPPFHAAVNAAVAVFLIVSLISIKLGKVRLHRATMVTAMLLSIVFLLSYVAYHMTTHPTRYGGEGILRTVYFVLLITHILFASVSLPFILFTFIAGWTNRFTVHKRLARWVFPLWLYVAVTGPLCYLMLRPYYG